MLRPARIILLALVLANLPRAFAASLDTNDLQQIVAQAATRAAELSPDSVIAIVDREGFVLVVWDVNAGSLPTAGEIGLAISKAGTAAFLSSDQHAFSSRTAGFIIMQHFPPLLPLTTNLPPFAPFFDPLFVCPFPNCRFPIPQNVRQRPPGPLVGVQYSSLPHSDINFFKQIAGNPTEAGTNGIPVLNPASPFALSGTPGGVPLYKNGVLVGGIGVTGDPARPGDLLPDPFEFNFKSRDLDEQIALAGQFGYAPVKRIFGSRVFVDGIRLPYIAGKGPRVAGAAAPGQPVPPFGFTNSPAISYPAATLGGVTGEIRNQIIDDPLGRLSAGQVSNILGQAAARAAITRARIRLPRKVPAQVFISVVNNPGTNAPPQVLGTFRTPDATIFSWDVAVQKARTAVFFSQRENLNRFAPGFSTDTDIAMSTRAVGFLAQSLYPPGIDDTEPGPFHMFQESVSSTISTAPPQPLLPNGITIFPGGFPLYDANGELIGAIGISGDGVDEDEIIGAAGTVDFPAPRAIRADEFTFRGARLPYAKFPRNPSF